MKKSSNTILPKGWRIASISEKNLINIIMGQSPPGDTYNKSGNGLPFFQGSKDFGALYPEVRVWCSKPQKIAEPNDILLSVRAPVGPTNLSKERCCIGRGVAALRCNAGLSFKYLLMVLRHYEKEIVGSGSIFTAIGNDEIKRIAFPLPPSIDEQIAISDRIEKKFLHFGQMRSAAERQLETGTTMEQAFLQPLFPFDDVKNPPSGWSVQPLRELRKSIEYGLSRSATKIPTGPKFLRITDIQNGEVNWNDVPYCECSETEAVSCKLENGDILFARTGATTGKSYLINNPPDAVFASYLIRVQCNTERVMPEYLYAFFQSKTYWKAIGKDARGGAQAGFNATMLGDLLVPLPPTKDNQLRIANEYRKRGAMAQRIKTAAARQLEAISALPAATLREFFHFGGCSNA